MCGIAGFSLSDADLGIIDAPKLARELLLNIEHRGRDATGAAWYEGEALMVQKDAMTASHFVKWMDIPQGARTAILHTRLGTQGSEKDNNNNHPVVTGTIVGVHNGVVYNDFSLFRDMGMSDQRIAQVDTEAIFAAIAYGRQVTEDGKFRLAPTLEGVLKKITGSAAIAWLEIEGDPNVLHVARIISSPLVVASTKNGSLVFASTHDAIKDALKAVNVEAENYGNVKEGSYFKVDKGEVVEAESFTPAYTSSGYYGGSSWDDWDDNRTVRQTDSVVRAVHALSSPKKDDDKKDDKKDDLKWTPYLSHETLHRHMIYQFMDLSIDVMDDAGMVKHYRNRLEDAQAYATEFGFEEADRCGAELRPGMWVMTDMADVCNDIDAQIVTMPQGFPGGSFVLRVLIPNSRYHDGYEVVLVERTIHEFAWLSANGTECDDRDDRPFDVEAAAEWDAAHATEPVAESHEDNIIDGIVKEAEETAAIRELESGNVIALPYATDSTD